MKAFRILTLHAFPSNDVAGLYAFSVTSMDFMQASRTSRRANMV